MLPKTKRILGMILQAPLVLVVLISFFISIYAAYFKLFGITYGAAIISGVIIALYAVGVFLVLKKSK